MKTIASLLILALAGLLSGCMSVEKALNGLPQVSATRLHVAQSNPIGSAQIDAVNLKQTPERATADSITVQVSAPFVGTTTVQLDGYVREKRPAP